MKYAIISDIHGNNIALQNVIAVAKKNQVKETWQEAFTAWEAHRKMNDTHITRVREEWLDIADSDWYMSYRKEDVIREILQSPQKAFHKKTWEVLCSSIPCFKNKKILIPSSGDNRAVFAFATLGADVISCDICEKQLQYAKEIADRNNLNIQFCVQDTMKLSDIGSEEYDLVYTSEGVHVWINQLPEMYKNIARVLKKDGFYINYEIHPFARPFAYEDGKPKEKEVVVLKDYEMTGPLEDGITYHWRLQDILNAICDSGLMICRLEEMHDERDKGHFWFYEEERRTMSQEEIDSYYDRKKNPLSALPQWFTVCCVKRGR